MKRILLASALVTASAFGAVAQQASGTLPMGLEAQLLTRVPGIDLSNLTSKQVDRLAALFSNPDDVRNGQDISGAVRSILDNAQ